MKAGKQIKNLLTSLLLFGLLAAGTPVNNYAGLKVITHKDLGISTIKKAKFKKIIFGEQQHWSNQKTVKIAHVVTSNSLGRKVAKDVYNMNPRQFNRYWFALVFENRGKAPETFASEEDLIKYVSLNPGSVAVVSDKAKLSGVSTLKITP